MPKNPKKKPVRVKVSYKKEGPAPKTSKSSVEIGVKATPDKTTYTPQRTMTGDPRYGKENAGNRDAKFIEDARKNKQEIAHDSEGKPYRAGTSTTVKGVPKMQVEVNLGKPDLRPVKKVETPVYAKDKPKKLKAMAMTYGTSKSGKGTTIYRNKVKAK